MSWRDLKQWLIRAIINHRARGLLSNGIRLLDEGKNAEAVVCLRRAAQGDPDSTVILVNYGVALHLSDQPNAALDTFGKALSLQSNCWPALINAASIHIGSGEADQAIALINKTGAPTKLPNEVIIVWVRALIDSGPFNEAFVTLRLCRTRFGDEPQFWLFYAIACQFRGLNKESEAAFRHLRLLEPASCDVQARHGRLLAECGEFGSARSLLPRTIRRSPDSIDSLAAMARVLEVFGSIRSDFSLYQV
jgi:Flp pilus assembly protein TadD